jgi:DNA-binding transcriptional MerR regulator
MDTVLPAIPAKRYFTIGEVSELCGVKAYVLRYWEQEFTQLRPMKRRGNRRYYQHHEVLLIRRIRELLYDQGFTISGARNRLAEATASGRGAAFAAARRGAGGVERSAEEPQAFDAPSAAPGLAVTDAGVPAPAGGGQGAAPFNRFPTDDPSFIVAELRAIRDLLSD